MLTHDQIEAKKEKARQRAKAWYWANRERALAASAVYQKEHRERSNEQKKQWKDRNRDAVRAADAAYHAANPEKAKIRGDRWRQLNPEKAKAQYERWARDNPEKVLASSRKYYHANREECLRKQAEWREQNRDVCTAASLSWQRRHPEAKRVADHNRRAKMTAGGKLSRGIVKKLFALQRGKCACCRQPLGDDYHLDHISPISRGGSNTDDNVQLLRARCNIQKHARDPVDFMQSRGFLL